MDLGCTLHTPTLHLYDGHLLQGEAEWGSCQVVKSFQRLEKLSSGWLSPLAGLASRAGLSQEADPCAQEAGSAPQWKPS